MCLFLETGLREWLYKSRYARKGIYSANLAAPLPSGPRFGGGGTAGGWNLPPPRPLPTLSLCDLFFLCGSVFQVSLYLFSLLKAVGGRR
jgi:hypothetical protein